MLDTPEGESVNDPGLRRSIPTRCWGASRGIRGGDPPARRYTARSASGPKGTGILAVMGDPAGAVVEVPSVVRELGERFRAAGHELYLVGGAVRDAILHRATPDHDLDLATSAPPQETIRLLRAARVDQLYLMGVKYGTIGARKDDHRLEITTFREEV